MRGYHSIFLQIDTFGRMVINTLHCADVQHKEFEMEDRNYRPNIAERFENITRIDKTTNRSGIKRF